MFRSVTRISPCSITRIAGTSTSRLFCRPHSPLAFLSTRTVANMSDPSTYKFNHSMLRVKDPARSVKFYEFLGFKLIKKIVNEGPKFDLYFLAYDTPDAPSQGKHWTDRQGVIELTHNYGTENDPNYKVHNGNSDPKGFGHVCISVDNIQAACQRIEDAGYKFQKKLTDGKMRHIAFALDPDDYWVEIISQRPIEETKDIKETDVSTYRMNHTMVRVKDPKKSAEFYEKVLGMKLMRTNENSDFTLYFYGYGPQASQDTANGVNAEPAREGLLELTWNHGTENDTDFHYNSGNEEPRGYGHIGITVDDLDAACERLDKLGVNWKKRLTEGQSDLLAFVYDPDGYWVEILQNEKMNTRAKW